MTATVQPATVVFWMYSGATFSAPVVIKDSSGNPIDNTGCTAILQARREIYDADPVFTLSTANGGIVLGGTNGAVTLNMSAAATKALGIDYNGEIFFHDLLLTNVDSSVDKPYQGVIVACPSVTR